MYPAYTWTDSHPRHTNPVHYAPNVHPRDRGTVNLPYYPWSYPIPQPCHSCCNHSYFGSPYSFTPHYPPPPPPPYHSHGFYPPFPGAHPAYSVPPPHYSIEQPKYDYDKNTPTPHRCSECEKKSNIVQEESNIDKKTTDSLVPFSKDYPYPIMWVPSNYMNTESKPKEKEKENHFNGPVIKPIEKPLKGEENGEIEHNRDNIRLPFPIFLLPSKNNEVKEDTKGDNHEEKTRKNDEVESSKNGVQKVIPVKQLETKEEKKTDGKKEEKNVTQKTSKLPPVCLRIDPLPKKKNASRSPSPPGEKERSKRSTTEDSKSFQQKELSEEVKNDDKKVEKDSGVVTCSEKGVVHDRSSEVEGLKVETKKKILSENEAVVMIQSVYRGFEVRKSQPLMKLRKIAEVRKQVVDLKNRVHDLVTTIDEKQKLVIGETIMSLLLKLDTIQGLHPTVRDIRKSVAKELVGLQEKLDSITCVKSETRSEETIPRTDCNDKCVENREIEEATDSHDHNGGQDRSADLQPQVESQNENTGELNNDRIPEQLVDDNIDDDKAQFDNNEGTVRLDVEDHEVEPANPIHDMKTAEHLVEQSSEEFNTNQVHMVEETEQPVEDFVQEKSDQTQSESGIGVDISEHDGGAEARAIDHEPQVESEGQNITIELTGDDEKFQVAMETEQPIDNVIQEKPDQAQPESGISIETMESVEKQSAIELASNQLETVEETAPPKDSDHTQAPICENVDCTEDVIAATVEVETELGKENIGNGVQENLEEAPMVDDVDGDAKEVLKEDFGAPPLSATESRVSSGGDKKLTQENEKLRAAVEELMKAGSEQVSVIRELTGRVKDLEKELLKKKRRKVKKSIRRPRGSVVEQELRACA